MHRCAAADAIGQLEQRSFPLSEHDQIEWPQLEHQFRPKGRLHPPGDDQGTGRHTTRDMRELKIEPERHARGGNTDDVPGFAQQLVLERALW